MQPSNYSKLLTELDEFDAILERRSAHNEEGNGTITADRQKSDVISLERQKSLEKFLQLKRLEEVVYRNVDNYTLPDKITPRSAAEFVETNVGGVQVLLDAIKASGRRIRFVQVSTDEVYGSIDSGSWTEQWPLMPNSPYSATKAGGELLARAYHRTHGLEVVITRCSNNYGSHHFPEKLIPLFVTNLLEGKKVPVYGNGKNVRDWLHVDDHCRGIHKVLMNGRAGEVYNIGGGRELTNNEITSLILAAMGKDDSSIEYVEDRKGHDLRYSVDWTKIKNELGYEPQVKFEDGLRETIQWYRDNEAWWKPLKERAGL